MGGEGEINEADTRLTDRVSVEAPEMPTLAERLIMAFAFPTRSAASS